MTSSVDFDYNGPPVCVSNGMALQLVSQFGIHNAWHAFLRMRGMKVNTDESNGAVDSLKYFRNKIGWLRREMQKMKEHKWEGAKREEGNLLNANFDTFLEAPNSLALREDAPKYPPEEDRQEFVIKEAKDAEWKPTEGRPVVTVQRDEADAVEVGTDQSAETAAAALVEVTKEQQQRKPTQQQQKGTHTEITHFAETEKDAKERKGAEGTAAEKKYATEMQQLQCQEDAVARRHAETIDDVVSLVLEKVRSNQPFEGELKMTSVPSAIQTLRFSQATGGQHFGTRPDNPSPMPSAGQSVFLLHTPSGAQKNSSPFVTHPQLIHRPMDKDGTHRSMGPHASSNSPFATPSHYQQTLIAAAGQTAKTLTAQSEFSPQKRKQPIQRQQQQQKHWGKESPPSADLLLNGIPLDLAIQRGMTVQELIQALKLQNKNQQQVIFSQSQLEKPNSLTISSKQKANDNEDQNAIPKILTKQKGMTKIANKNRKRKEMASKRGDNENKINDGTKRRRGEQTKQKQQTTTTRGTGTQKRERTEAEEEQKGETEGRFSELEAQLKKAQKQLTKERNKATGHKKRAEKLQTELEKNVDTIQMLQIDLACLKTDNNNLIAENIALKAENQKLRLKGSTSTAHKRTAIHSTNETPRGRGKATGRSRRGKQKIREGTSPLPEKTRTPPPLSGEFGRRQSKRICVVRSKFVRAFC